MYERYFDALGACAHERIRKGHIGGFASGANMFIVFSANALVRARGERLRTREFRE